MKANEIILLGIIVILLCYICLMKERYREAPRGGMGGTTNQGSPVQQQVAPEESTPIIDIVTGGGSGTGKIIGIIIAVIVGILAIVGAVFAWRKFKGNDGWSIPPKLKIWKKGGGAAGNN